MSKSLQALFEGARLIEISERDAAGTLLPGWTAKPLRASLRPYTGGDWTPHAKEGLGTVTGEALERFRTQLQTRLAARRWPKAWPWPLNGKRLTPVKPGKRSGKPRMVS